MRSIFLSVIIPTLNEEKYLPGLLSSLVLQTSKEFEIIISDGKSDDNIIEKALEFKDRLSLKVYNSERRNLAHQRNLGAKKAKGDYLIFLDADCRFEANFIELILEKITKTDTDVIIPVILWDTEKPFWRAHAAFQNFFAPFTRFSNKPLGNGSAAVIRKALFEKIGGYDESLFTYEDQYILQLAKQNGAKFYYPKNLKIYSSIRRIERWGAINYFYNNILAGFYHFFLGPVRKRLYDYEMGGQAHEIAS